MPIPHRIKKTFDESLILGDAVPEEGKEIVAEPIEEVASVPVADSSDDNKVDGVPIVSGEKPETKGSAKKRVRPGASVKKVVGMKRFNRDENAVDCHVFINVSLVERLRFISARRRVSVPVVLNDALEFYLENHPDAAFLKKLK